MRRNRPRSWAWGRGLPVRSSMIAANCTSHIDVSAHTTPRHVGHNARCQQTTHAMESTGQAPMATFLLRNDSREQWRPEGARSSHSPSTPTPGGVWHHRDTHKTSLGFKKRDSAPPRIELGSREPKSRMLPTTPWGSAISSQRQTYSIRFNFLCSFFSFSLLFFAYGRFSSLAAACPFWASLLLGVPTPQEDRHRYSFSLVFLFCSRSLPDTSIWLVQFSSLVDDRTGKPLPFSQLRGLFTRICKLLFFGAKPGFSSPVPAAPPLLTTQVCSVCL